MSSATESSVGEKEARARLKRTRRVAGWLAALGAAAMISAALAVWQSRRAEQQGAVVREREREARHTGGMVEFDAADEAMRREPADLLDAERHLVRAVVVDPQNRLAATRLHSLRRKYARPVVAVPEMQHGGSIVALMHDPHSNRLATASTDGRALLWDPGTGSRAAPVLQHEAALTSVSFSPDALWIVTTSRDHTAQVWDPNSGKPQGPRLAHRAPVRGAHFSPDSTRLVTCSEDGTAIIWEVTTGRQAVPPLVQGRDVTSARFSPDGTKILTTSTDGEVRLWNAVDGTLFRTTGSGLGSVFTLSGRFSPDGKLAAITSGMGYSMLMRLPPDGSWEQIHQSVRGRPTRLEYSGDFLPSIFSPDGKLFATPTTDPAWMAVRDVETGHLQHIQPLHTKRINAAAFSSDGERMATAGRDRLAKVWNVRTGEMPFLPLEHDSEVTCVEFYQDARRLLTGDAHGVARLWNMERPAPAPVMLVNRVNEISEVWDVACRHDGKMIATAGNDRHVRFWDAQTYKETAAWDTELHVRACAYSPDDRYLVVTQYKGHDAIVWDTVSRREYLRLTGARDAALAARFSPDGTRIAAAIDEHSCAIWTLPDAAHPLVIPLESHVAEIAWTNDGQQIIAACEDGTARWIDALTGKLAGVSAKHDRAVNTCDVSRDGRLLATGSADRSVRLWDARTGEARGERMEHPGEVKRVRFSPDSRRIASMCETGEARVWDVEASRTLYEPFHGEKAGGSSVGFTADGSRVISCMKQAAALVWSLDTPEQ